MPICVVTYRDGNELSEFYPSRKLFRVGASPDSDVKIPGSDSTIALVESRDDSFRVHNRSSSELALGSALLKPGEAGSWTFTSPLRIDDRFELKIFDRSPRSAYLSEADDESLGPVQRSDIEEEEVEEVPKRETISPGRALQYAVIVLCGIACVGLIALKVTGYADKMNESAVEAPEFSTVFPTLYDLKDPQKTDLRIRLQEAETLYVEKKFPESRKRYDAIRFRLQEADAVDEETRELVESFVDGRLKKIAER